MAGFLLFHTFLPARRGPCPKLSWAAVRTLLAFLALTWPTPGSAGPEPTVPRPEAILGFRPGDDYKLADYNAMLQYFRRVAELSERVQLEEVGRSSLGRPIIMATITSPANFPGLDRYRAISRRLAHAEGIDDGEARRLAQQGKAVIYIDSGLHATEVAPAQHSFELLYHLATDESPQTRMILDRVILIFFPCVNPDGLDGVVRWYNRNVGTPYEVSPMTELYAKYVGHDNNRDWFMFTQPETRSIGRILFHEWLPQIVHNHHQGAPFPARIFVPPFDDPMNPNIHPLVMRGVQLVGSAVSVALAERGRTGVVSRQVYSTWWNGGLRTTPYFHNMVGILTETAGYRYATPKFYTPDELPETFGNGISTSEPSTFYPNPWRGGWWRLRDAIDYMLVASLAVLDVGARYRKDWLYNIYRMGRDSIESGTKEPPYAFVIPARQRDPGAAVALVNKLIAGGVEVTRANASFTADGAQFSAGSYVIQAAQAFRPLILDLLRPQNHPDQRVYAGGPPKKPYDVTGWTLPLSMGVRSAEVTASFEAAGTPVGRAELPTGRVEGNGNLYLLDPAVNGTFTAVNRLFQRDRSVYRARRALELGRRTWPPGTFVVRGDGALRRLAEEHGLQLGAADRVRGAGWRIEQPRVAIYRSWVPNRDGGWTRWLLDKFEFPFTDIRNAEIKQPGLEESYDAILLPDSTVEKLLNGHEQGSVPPEYVGGIGTEGVARLQDFVRAGGTLICLDSAAELAVEYFQLPIENALEDIQQAEFYCPGSLLEIEFDPSHPLAYGMPDKGVAFFRNSAAYNLVPDFDAKRGLVVARYPDRNPLLSGWILGGEYLQRKAAVVDVPYGKGRVIVLGFRTQFRGQTHGTFKLLFNALYYAASAPAPLP